MNHEYLGIDGLPAFTSASARLILGEQSPAITEGRTVTVQSLSVRTNRLIQFSSVPYPTIERTNPEKDGRIISQSIFAELPSHRLDASVFFFFCADLQTHYREPALFELGWSSSQSSSVQTHRYSSRIHRGRSMPRLSPARVSAPLTSTGTNPRYTFVSVPQIICASVPALKDPSSRIPFFFFFLHVVG